MKVVILVLLAVAVRAQTCPGNILDAKTRQEIVNQHNRLRSSLTSSATNSAKLSGRNIYALRYDCTLEAQAQTHANKCLMQRSSLDARREAGQNIFAGENIFTFKGYHQAAGAISSSIQQWWHQIFANPWNGDGNNVYTDAVHRTGIDSFAQIAWGSTTRVGCGYNVCKGFKSVVCQYLTGGPKIDETIFEVGSGCAGDDECTLFPGSTCNTTLKLCQAPDNVNPLPVPTTTTTTTTTTEPPQSCSESPDLDDTIRATIIEKHNALRTKIAKGETIGAVFLRGCKDMFALKYDCGLERAANALSEACLGADSVAVFRGRNSKYVDDVGTAALSAREAVNAALAEWEAQIATFKIDKKIGHSLRQNTIAQVGFFAQMAWSRTIKVGCSYSKCSATKTIVVCIYDPWRANRGQQVYTPASTKSGCVMRTCAGAVPAQSICNRTTGLCEAP